MSIKFFSFLRNFFFKEAEKPSSDSLDILSSLEEIVSADAKENKRKEEVEENEWFFSAIAKIETALIKAGVEEITYTDVIFYESDFQKFRKKQKKVSEWCKSVGLKATLHSSFYEKFRLRIKTPLKLIEASKKAKQEIEKESYVTTCTNMGVQ